MRKQMCRFVAVGVALQVAWSASTLAQTVELRIVERQGQAQVTPPFTDSTLDYAVQGRVVGAPGKGIHTCLFDIHIAGEPEAFGTLAKVNVSNANGTYNTGATQYDVNSTIGRGGLSAMYVFLAAVSGPANGNINTSSGGFVNGPDQEIGGIVAYTSGTPALLLGDLNNDGNPDTYSGSGATAPLAATLANTYMGANGNFVDLYHFRYVLSNTTTFRSNPVTLERVSATVCSTWLFQNGNWGFDDAPASVSVASIPLVVTGSGPCCTSSGACSVTIQSGCAGTWTLGGTCGVGTCPQPGACCSHATCTSLLREACAALGGQFRGLGVACLPNGRVGSCCPADFNANGAVTVQDIFDFISAWFAADPRADFDQNLAIGVNDIFVFLSSWFAGCP